MAFTYCTKNPAAKKAATSSCGRHNISGITSANAFYSKIAADRKVEPPIPHSCVTQRWAQGPSNVAIIMSLQGRWHRRCFGSVGFSFLLEYKVKIMEKHRFRLIQSLVIGIQKLCHPSCKPFWIKSARNKAGSSTRAKDPNALPLLHPHLS